MREKVRSGSWLLIVALSVFATAIGTAKADGPTEQVVYEFGMTTDSGQQPYSPVIFDHAGNLYGTTSAGGLGLNGTVFELSLNSDGSWKQTTLYDFGSVPNDGNDPVSGLVFDSAGNLYGTTKVGGTWGFGTVFQLVPGSASKWTENQLYSFQSGRDGAYPFTGVVLDAAGHIYGTTAEGGDGFGTVFELAQQSNGTWKERLLHTFTNGRDGSGPGTLVIDGSGNLFDIATQGGGEQNCGLIFEISPAGTPHYRILHSFTGVIDGCGPQAGLLQDPSGNFWGATEFNLFELRHEISGWSFHSLYTFAPGQDTPIGTLVMDISGNLYDTTYFGGSAQLGTVFEVSPIGHGKWTYQVLHSFSDNIIGPVDGWIPNAGLAIDFSGRLYGTTIYGGYFNNGVVFEVTP